MHPLKISANGLGEANKSRDYIGRSSLQATSKEASQRRIMITNKNLVWNRETRRVPEVVKRKSIVKEKKKNFFLSFAFKNTKLEIMYFCK